MTTKVFDTTNLNRMRLAQIFVVANGDGIYFGQKMDPIVPIGIESIDEGIFKIPRKSFL